MLCPMSKSECATCDPQQGCAMARGVGYSQVQQEPQDPVAQAQADSLEAHSLKYHHCAQVFQLSSGNFALFGSFAPGEGIPLIAIGSWQELEPHVREYKRIADEHAERPRPMKVDVKAKPSTAYDDLFGEE